MSTWTNFQDAHGGEGVLLDQPQHRHGEGQDLVPRDALGKGWAPGVPFASNARGLEHACTREWVRNKTNHLSESMRLIINPLRCHEFQDATDL